MKPPSNTVAIPALHSCLRLAKWWAVSPACCDSIWSRPWLSSTLVGQNGPGRWSSENVERKRKSLNRNFKPKRWYLAQGLKAMPIYNVRCKLWKWEWGRWEFQAGHSACVSASPSSNDGNISDGWHWSKPGSLDTSASKTLQMYNATWHTDALQALSSPQHWWYGISPNSMCASRNVSLLWYWAPNLKDLTLNRDIFGGEQKSNHKVI